MSRSEITRILIDEYCRGPDELESFIALLKRVERYGIKAVIRELEELARERSDR